MGQRPRSLAPCPRTPSTSLDPRRAPTLDTGTHLVYLLTLEHALRDDGPQLVGVCVVDHLAGQREHRDEEPKTQ